MRVIIVDDAMLIRSGLSRLLTEAGVEVVAEVTNARDLLRRCHRNGRMWTW
jgi:DNA-binding NarL/FixJ family response regulator